MSGDDINLSWYDLHAFTFLGLNRKAVSRIYSMPALNFRNATKGSTFSNKNVSNSIQAMSHYSLEVGSMAEVISLNGLTVYGVIRWIGVPDGKKNYWAGLELVSIYIFSLSSTEQMLIMLCFVHANDIKKSLNSFQDNEVTTCSDGTLGTIRYFTCEGNKALFVPLTNCKPDSRFLFISNEIQKPLEPPSGEA